MKHKNILLSLYSSQPGGIETYTFNLAKILKEKGFNIIIIAFSSGIMEKKYLKNNIDYRIFKGGRYNPFYIFKLIRLIKKENMNLIHLQQPLQVMPLIFFLFIGLIFKRKILSTYHSTISAITMQHNLSFKKYFVKKKYQFIYKCALRVSSMNIVNSYYLKNELEKDFGNFDIQVSYNGIETLKPISPEKKREVKDSLSLNRQDIIIGTLSRISPEKGLEFFFEVLMKIKKLTSSRLKAIHIGDSSDPKNNKYKTELMHYVKMQNLEKDIIFTGFQPDPSSLLSILDIFILTSRIESFGLAVIEAMSQQKPVVAFDIGGVREIVMDGETGFLVPYGDINTFTNVVLKLIDSPSLRKEMGVAGYERYCRYFSLISMGDNIEGFYRKIL
ncbi:MAG: glycosyltransferase family 4 protein [Thermodesulfobacteriota bacterium]|nr:glycosyltransferase family 4 protein [Thermodesulfobacteriota bacterium]